MGFCIFSSVADRGACGAQAAGSWPRWRHEDFDIHHGNGTQAALGGRPDLHSWRLDPVSGSCVPAPAIRMRRSPANIVNTVSRRKALSREVWKQGLREGLMDEGGRLRARPDPGLGWLRRAPCRDPVGGGGQNLEEADFAWATRAIASVANRHAKGPWLSSLEGGYDLEALGRSALAHVRALGEGVRGRLSGSSSRSHGSMRVLTAEVPDSRSVRLRQREAGAIILGPPRARPALNAQGEADRRRVPRLLGQLRDRAASCAGQTPPERSAASAADCGP